MSKNKKEVQRSSSSVSHMANRHLQISLEVAERRYKKHIELSLNHADTSEAMYAKIKELHAEAELRQVGLVSLQEKEPGMHKFLANAYKVEEMFTH